MSESLTDSHRRVKRSIIAVIYILLWAFFLSLIYWLFGPAPASCVDKIRNGRETGVDCGGDCKACFEDTLKNVAIKEVLFLPAAAGRVDLLGLVYNPNPSVGVRELEYEFSLFDAGGNLIRAIDNSARGDDIIFKEPIYIWPQTLRPIILPNIKVDSLVAKVDLNVRVARDGWAKESVVAPPQLFVKPSPGFRLTQGGGAFAAYNGLVHNSSSVEFQQVSVDVVARDRSGRVVAVNRQEVNNLRPDEDRVAEFAWFKPDPYLAALNNDSFSFTVSTNIYLPGNVVQRGGPLQEFQRP